MVYAVKVAGTWVTMTDLEIEHHGVSRCNVGGRAANQQRVSRASPLQRVGQSCLGERDIGCGRVKAEMD